MTPRGTDHPHELLSASLDGELTVRERRELDTHLADCAECREMLDDLVTISAAQRDDVPPVPAGLHGLIRERVGFVPAAAVAPRRRRPAWRSPWALAAAASVVAAVAVGVFVRQQARVGDWDMRQQAIPAGAAQDAPAAVEPERVEPPIVEKDRAPAPPEPSAKAPPAERKGVREESAPAPPPAASAARPSSRDKAGESADSAAEALTVPQPAGDEVRAIGYAATGQAARQNAPAVVRAKSEPGHANGAPALDLTAAKAEAMVPPVRVQAADPAAFWVELEGLVARLGGKLGSATETPRSVWVPSDRAAELREWLRARGATGLPAEGATGVLYVIVEKP